MHIKTSIYNIERASKVIILLLAVAIAAFTFFMMNSLAKSLSEEERGKVQLWAEATKELATMSDECDVNFVQTVIARNTSIPVILMDDSLQNVLSYRNISAEKDDADRLAEIAKDFAAINDPIEIDLGDGDRQYICYGESNMLKRLSYYPLVYVFVFLLYVILVVVVLLYMKRAEQNRVWVGLSKETAHQLGTPISSLLAWTEFLKARYPQDDMLPELERDVTRLRTIAERFSQIGSKAELSLADIDATTAKALEYMRGRISRKISITYKSEGPEPAMLNVPLYEWVIENLCKNAADAMDGEGSIDVNIRTSGSTICIDVKDTGKGISLGNYNRVFYPGFTTKKRGWGLGLSLAKRIIEEYHKGRIYIKHSETGKGTTFRIELPVAQ